MGGVAQWQDVRERCSIVLLSLILIVSSAGCGRKGPLKPLKPRSPVQISSSARSRPIVLHALFLS